MKSARDYYKELKQKLFSKNSLYNIYDALDKEIANNMIKNGYSTKEVAKAFLEKSYALKNKSTKEVASYLESHIPKNNIFTQHEVSPIDEYLSEIKRYSFRFEDSFMKNDLDIVCNMLDKGYKLEDIANVLKEQSIFAKQVNDKKLTAIYCDKILKNINKERELRAGKIYSLAKKAYITKATALVNKYENYSKDNFNEFNEGSIVIDMMINDHFFPEIVEQVIRRNTFNTKANEAYFLNIMVKCRKIKQIYVDIAASVNKELRTEADAYKVFAHDYMQHTGTKILNGRDDQQIVKRMFAEKWTKDMIQKALLSSPVALEPGRNLDKYINTIISVVENDYKKVQNYLKEQLPLTKEAYNKKISAFSARLEDAGYVIDKHRSYYDGLAVFELLNEKHSPQNIIKILLDSPQALKKTNKVNKTPAGYANWIVSSAKKAMHFAKEILNFEDKSIPMDLGYKQLIKKGITPLDLYRQAIKERIAVYPSVASNLIKGFVDKDAIEKLLTRYPDMDKEALSDVLYKYSPRNMLPGIPAAYPARIMNEVIEKLKIANKFKENNELIQKEYNRQCGLATEGVDIGKNMDIWQDGRAALRMLLNNVDKDDIRAAIMTAARTASASAPLTYADKILNKVEAVKERLYSIKDYQPVPKSAQLTASDEYKDRIHQMYVKKKFVQSSMDFTIAKDMILENKFTIDEIRRAVRENSPIAIEPGRDGNYENYVEAKAREAIEAEKEKLNNYKVIPRIDAEKSSDAEYEYHKKQLQENIMLPYTSNMDNMIAQTMLIQGFAIAAIAETLNKKSPCAKLAQKHDYGVNIVHSIQKNLAKENIHSYTRTLMDNK